MGVYFDGGTSVSITWGRGQLVRRYWNSVGPARFGETMAYRAVMSFKMRNDRIVARFAMTRVFTAG